MRIPIFPILPNVASSVVSSVGSQLFVPQKSFLNTSNGKLNESSEEKGCSSEFLLNLTRGSLNGKKYVSCLCLLSVQNAFQGFSILIWEISKTQLIFEIMLLLFCVVSLFSSSFWVRFLWSFSSFVFLFMVSFFGQPTLPTSNFMFC
jgi:hypothetical protein